MTEKQANNRYYKAFIPAFFLYVVGILLAVWARDNLIDAQSVFDFWAHNPIEWAQQIYYLLALIPIVAICIVAWAQWRFINELDEVLRMVQIKGLLFGLLCILAIATGWGLLEMLIRVPQLPIFWLVPIFIICQSVGIGFAKARERGIGYEE